MRFTALFFFAASVAVAQTSTKPATTTAKPSSAATQSSAKPASATARPATAAKPASEMPVLHGIVKPLFTERYEEIKVGTGAVAEPNKMYHVLYSGYLAATGQKFDASSDHPAPLIKDGKAVFDANNKPVMGPPQPLVFPQGMGRLIPGFDQGVAGMHIGGKRRIFIPWELAYGTRDIPPREGHIGIPAKSDLIFDVELVDVTDIPTGPAQPLPARPATPPPGSQPTAPPTGSAPPTPPPASTPSPVPDTK